MLRAFFTITLLALATFSIAAQSDDSPMYPAQLLTAEQALADIDLLQTILAEVHPGTTRYTDAATIAAAFATLSEQAADGMSDEQLYLAISRLMALVRDEHAKVEYPQALRDHRADVRVHLPLRFRLFDGRMFVVSANNRSQLEPGTEILSINGVAVGDILTTLSAYVPIDGFTDATIAEALADESDYIDVGSAFEQYYPSVYGWTERYTLEIVAPGATEREMRAVAGIRYTSWARLPFDDNATRARDFRNAVQYDNLGAGVGLLRIDTFVNYRVPVDPIALYDDVFTTIAADGIDHLIVDLRRNSGGSTDAAVGLLRFLLAEPFTLIPDVQMRTVTFADEWLPYLNSWDRTYFELRPSQYTPLASGFYQINSTAIGNVEEQPHPNRYTGRVTALSSQSNSSGSTMLLAHLQASGRATIVGQATGGSVAGPTAGTIAFLTLPNSGVVVRIPLLLQGTGLTPAAFGSGVRPDVLVPFTVEDYFNGVDAALEAARAR